MADTTELLDIVSGRKQGVVAWTTRSVLGCLTPIYRLGVWWRNRRFDHQGGNTVPVPVISIGNLTTGGTGKTPMVIWLAQLLQSRSLRVAIISRGYGKENTGAEGNDEALELENRLPNIPHLQNPQRTEMARRAIEIFDSQVIVLDDGFQHRRLNRDLDIVLIDATEPFGYGRLLPRGLLREPIGNISRANVIVLTRCDSINEHATQQIRQRVQKHAPKAGWARSKTVTGSWLQSDGDQSPLEALKNKKTLAVCGIGNPKGFRHSLSRLDVTVERLLRFPDHHGYSAEDLQSIQATAEELGVDAIVCTHKDLVKIGVPELGKIPVFALLVSIEFVEGEPQLIELIDELLPATSP